MKTDIKTVATLLAASIWTDGIYDDKEKEILSEIAEALKVDKKALVENIEAELATIKDASEDVINDKIKAVKVDPADKGLIYEAVLEIVLADDILSRAEVGNLLAMAEVLGMTDEEAIILLVEMSKDVENLEIVF